jgi:hypothetical protein
VVGKIIRAWFNHGEILVVYFHRETTYFAERKLNRTTNFCSPSQNEGAREPHSSAETNWQPKKPPRRKIVKEDK